MDLTLVWGWELTCFLRAGGKCLVLCGGIEIDFIFEWGSISFFVVASK